MEEEDKLHTAMNKAALNLESAQAIYNQARKNLFIYLQKKKEEVVDEV